MNDHAVSYIDSVHRVGACVRELMAASCVIREAASRADPTPQRRAVEALCNAILTELAALTEQCPPIEVAEDVVALRLGRLLLEGKSLVDECDAGLYDDPHAGWSRLARRARELDGDYATLLHRFVTPPTLGCSA